MDDEKQLHTLLWMFERGEALLKHAAMVYPDIGVTILVHETKLEPGNLQVAVSTSLPTRKHQRIVLAEALARALMVDGVAPEDVAHLAAADLKEFETGKRT